MNKLDKKCNLPEGVLEERKSRLREMTVSCFSGMSVRLIIIIAEFLGVYFYGSAALLMDAIASFVDLFCTSILLFCIRIAAKPPDENHPLGHGRFEPLIGLQLGLFISLVGVWLFIQQGMGLFELKKGGESINPNIWMIPFFATLLLEISYQVVSRTAKRLHSPALAADAIHYRIDGMTSLLATLALLLGVFIPDFGHFIDHLGAFFISLFMIVMGFNASRENIYQLTDHLPDEMFFNKVKIAAKRDCRVLGTDKIRIQQYGPNAHIDIDIEVDPQLSVELAHGISRQVRAEIQKEWPSVLDVIVHIEPYYPKNDTLKENFD